ncbi:carotenoid-cleaving dioxygenase, mitochondrial-like [Ruditapes philippinarum]|uniref:carotenoid-cleaving dioxygenase, mitochondrial-like n=1 Tax=Ruditapes philippinarum TaxID=129788 RepID=UPI00295BB278|nr:carotenoid-cleaving dioxygenase, mitochondrial-like [Ruditapes philippinarum]
MHKLFQTIHEEYKTPVDGTVIGDIPGWLCGSLYRNGPGMYEVGEDKYKHWLDPLAMLQCFRIRDKKASYQCRYLHSDAYTKAMEAKRIVVHEFGTVGTPDPCINSFKRQLSHFEMDDSTDNTNVSFFPFKDELYAATERNFINRIDPDTLDRLEKVKLEDYVAVNSGTAHPHWDPDGTIHNLGNTYQGWPKTCLVRIPPKKDKNDDFPQGQVVASLASQSKMHINYLHSFGMSENYYVFIEQPLHMSMKKIASTKIQEASLEWKPQSKPRFRIVDKKTGAEVNANIRFETGLFMFMHHINTFEDNGHLVVDIIAYRKDSVLQYLYLKNLTIEQCEKEHRKIEDPLIRRYVIPLKIKPNATPATNLVTLSYTKATAKRRDAKTVFLTHEILCDIGIEFPQINYRNYNTKKYRYVYGVGWHSKADIIHTLVKIDTETNSYKQWKCENCFPTEPVFVPRPESTTEDDGVLLSAVSRTDFDEKGGANAFLLILDARSMQEIARADFGVPRFPKDLHGIFRPT